VIVLDTNVVSELARESPAPAVIEWLDSLAAEDVATTAIAAAELFYGVARLPSGRRKSLVSEAVRRVLHEDLRDRVEVFDLSSAERYGALVAARERAGRPISIADAQIAAVCAVRQATLATRNTKDFEGTGIDVINPWEQGGPT
jgi:toxin FitB